MIPTVGVFVDGMYYGINAGIVVDNFDLEAIEVLRGPQGTLYGRNVTGGAVLVRTALPDDEFELTGAHQRRDRAGLDRRLCRSPDRLRRVCSCKVRRVPQRGRRLVRERFRRFAVWCVQQLNIYRLALRATPTDAIDMILRLEQGYSESDGPASQNHGFGQDERGSFDFAINNPGYADRRLGTGDFRSER